jgi:hypothetical protein
LLDLRHHRRGIDVPRSVITSQPGLAVADHDSADGFQVEPRSRPTR